MKTVADYLEPHRQYRVLQDYVPSTMPANAAHAIKPDELLIFIAAELLVGLNRDTGCINQLKLHFVEKSIQLCADAFCPSDAGPFDRLVFEPGLYLEATTNLEVSAEARQAQVRAYEERKALEKLAFEGRLKAWQEEQEGLFNKRLQKRKSRKDVAKENSQ